MRREDTVVSLLPEFDRDRTRPGNASPDQVKRAIASLGDGIPPLPSRWRQSEQSHRVPPPPPPVQASPARVRVTPIPEPCFEPSVVAAMPFPKQALALETLVSAETTERGKIVVMFGCRGGAGATTLAVNTASALVRARKSVVVVDLDLQLGDVFVALDLHPENSIAALAREASTIDGAALRRRLARHDSGIYALTQVGHVDDCDGQTAERLPALLSRLSDTFDYVIVDGVRDFGDCALSALDMADQIAMVMSQDVASVRRAARGVALFRRLGYSDAKIRLILNRCVRSATVTDADVVTALGLPIAARIRNDFGRMQLAFNDGALVGDIAPTSRVYRDIEGLARLLAPADNPGQITAPVKKQSIFTRLRRKTAAPVPAPALPATVGGN